MVKLKIRQYVIGSIITIAIIGTAVTFCFESPRPSVAQVLYSKPIRSTVAVSQSYCHITVSPIPATAKDITESFLPNHEYRILTLINTLKVKREYPALKHSELKNCVIVDVKQPRVVGYDVVYRIGDKTGKIRIPYIPGETIPLNEKGQLILKVQ
ncbi:UmoD family flagellar biogenesis regulator [Xenorhabdus miraniensis]|uniref:UmoD n=1 Tax=Xenorhabdus miraniensis TaxID=351674 RepID=A0A2D0JUJ7_9GAMM|nr:UmoD family flagellar biogenesis regulator [Xenorhabdus miraniensis]PHM50018.1 UmoD [Xenorhabdus miraniensis]